MGLLGVVIVLTAFAWAFAWLYRRHQKIHKLLEQIQGPTPLPLIGNLHQFRFNPDGSTNIRKVPEFFEQAQGVAYMFKEHKDRMSRIWLGPLPFVLIYGAEECEAVLGSTKMLRKMFHYNFLSAWIGDGLLISQPDKWKPRRKLLTPTFHYDILKDFVEVYNRHSATLISKFDQLVGQDYTDIFHTISLCTLDIICEAALGTNIDAQNTQTDYLDAVFRMKCLLFQRMLNPIYYPDFIFNIFGEGKEQKRCVRILHEFTGKVIVARRKMLQEAGGIEKLMEKKQAGGTHTRLAFLDLMLGMVEKGELDLEGLEEETNTFTFEGHDTTSAAMNWFLHLMGNNPEIQARVHKEVDEVLGGDGREVTYEDLGNLRYLEACFKETLRLYPSVPLIGRQCTEDTQIGNYVIPSGTGVVIAASMVHRDPRFWPNPEVFDPERFMDADLKHPYSYIPFSAGSRNCIGQRFAIMEEKCVIANIMRRFKVKAKLRTDQMRVAAELIIRPMYGNEIRFERRSYGDYEQIRD